MLQACLNGARSAGFHDALPQTSQELAKNAVAAINAGADELHVHPQDSKGIQTLNPDDVAACLRAIRSKVPNIPIGLSTLWTIPPGGRARQRFIREWYEIPDYVSVNLSEDDAFEIMQIVLDKRIGIEAGLSSEKDARRLIASPYAKSCLRILIEIEAEQELPDAFDTMEKIIKVLEEGALGLPILLHGFDVTMWPLFDEALKRRFDVRIGLEDGKNLPTGEKTSGNEEMIRVAAHRLNAFL